MWYVNNAYGEWTTARGVGFILTMWYVNLHLTYILLLLHNAFYINYVVCK